MDTTGVIVEYNPFHNGHLHQINQIRAQYPDTTIVAIMSGQFLQRGIPAALDKESRTRQALQSGVDLMIELPVAFSVQPADLFAKGAIKLLSGMKITRLVFGAEHPKLDFKSIAVKIQNIDGDFDQFNETYASQYQQAVFDNTGIHIDEPNDLLGLAYAEACLSEKAEIQLCPIQRIGAGYHETIFDDSQEIASATAIRLAIKNQESIENVVPSQTKIDSENEKWIDWYDFWPYLKYQLSLLTPEQLSTFYGMSEGIEYRLLQQYEKLPEDASFDDWVHAVKSKRVTYTKISRLATYILLKINKNEIDKQYKQPYYHVLGFSKRGQSLLNYLKKEVPYPILTKISKKDKEGLYSLDYRAGIIYGLVSHKKSDLFRHPVQIN
ncbi:nucleotidyltransferase [Dellaglioa carnosa]|uniref:tRNA(Met) cytidine acetate ligase n=1 Tax=Dellaglioa carnosa TaxID=2995136 RepID=A0ABT4JL65_9LACO|nr:nucleotidyltransferase [Dellaglioa carnosa]MCZ2491096.1 nucleotidyltransferase [Dellaglioa carnosa]MCZ2494174.1 nucleotidyltransferase [Dellaglioa carnosa]MDK1731037.1 nucleotidyltransferase [Dellaglioa carnosa]